MEYLLEDSVLENFLLKNEKVSDEPILKIIDSNYCKGTFLKDFLSKKRQLLSGPACEDSKYPARRLTPKKTWRFMGVSYSNFDESNKLISNTRLYKQSGNSIVVPLMTVIFSELF